jgi:peptidoglycan/xylan/chitin deacetylase (PgdA/CDA1 family)
LPRGGAATDDGFVALHPGRRVLAAAAIATAVASGAAAAQAAPSLPGQAAQQAELQRLARTGLPVYCGAPRGNLVALTFDDGPGPYTGLALRELRGAGARATFFLVSRSIASFPQWPRRESRLAAIGDHTETHPYLPGLAPTAAAAQIAGGRAAAQRAAGVAVDLFRPPYGARSPMVDQELRRDGLVDVLWSIDSTDSRVSPPSDYRAITAQVLHNIRPGAIVLFHENRGQTIRALRLILPALQRRGLRAVTVPELLAADPPSRALLHAGWSGCASGGAPRDAS